MNKEPEPADDNLQDTAELDVEAIFRACDEAASHEQEADQTEPTDGQSHKPYQLREVFGSGRIYYRDDNGEEVILKLDKWS